MVAGPHLTERAQLCNLLAEKGPGAPTLCEGWTTHDLAIHLYVRERRPLAALGILVPGPPAALLKYTSERTRGALAYDRLVGRLRSGPPLAARPFDRYFLHEYFVHHEDVRRAGGEGTFELRSSGEMGGLEDGLWREMRFLSKVLARRVPVGLELHSAGRERITAKRGSPAAVLEGRPSEILLYLMGRGAVARIVLEGPEEVVAAVHSTSFAI